MHCKIQILFDSSIHAFPLFLFRIIKYVLPKRPSVLGYIKCMSVYKLSDNNIKILDDCLSSSVEWIKPKIYRIKAAMLLNQKNYEESISSINMAIKREKCRWFLTEYACFKGLVYFKQKQYDTAITYFNSAINSEKVLCRSNQGKNILHYSNYFTWASLVETNMENEGIKYLLRAINYAKNSDLGSLFKELGISYYKIGKYDKAESALWQSVKIIKNDPDLIKWYLATLDHLELSTMLILRLGRLQLYSLDGEQKKHLQAIVNKNSTKNE